ncbi:MAG: hypothetical protein NTX53_06510 [candidate division WOR-3 bacterium]|nr:hypothetical protein [candidate division WOR-3 bacterium]
MLESELEPEFVSLLEVLRRPDPADGGRRMADSVRRVSSPRPARHVPSRLPAVHVDKGARQLSLNQEVAL